MLNGPETTTFATTTPIAEKGVLIWRLTNYRLLNKDNRTGVHYSPKFKVGAHEWVVSFFPNGDKDEFTDNACLFLNHHCTNNCKVDAIFTITVVSKKDAVSDKAQVERKQFNSTTPNWGYSLLPRIDLEERYVTDDCLEIITQVEIVEETVSTMSVSVPSQISSKDTAASHCHKLERLVREPLKFYSDVEFILEDGATAHAHRAVLAAQSPVFETMFASGMRESTERKVNVPDIDKPTFTQLLLFIYTGTCDEEYLIENTDKLLAAADKYELNGLKTKCENVLLSRLDIENAADVVHIADLYHAAELKEHVVNFIVGNYFHVITTPAYVALCSGASQIVAEISELAALKNGVKKRGSLEASPSKRARQKKL